MADEKSMLPKEKEVDTVHNRLKEIIKEYTLESDIPYYHEYWNLRNRYQYLAKGGK